MAAIAASSDRWSVWVNSISSAAIFDGTNPVRSMMITIALAPRSIFLSLRVTSLRGSRNRISEGLALSEVLVVHHCVTTTAVARLDELLLAGRGERNLRGTGRLDTQQIAWPYLAPM